MNKNQKTESNHGSYLKAKYSLKPANFDEKLNAIVSTCSDKNVQRRGASKFNSQNKENEDPSNNPTFVSDAQGKKIVKIGSLFLKEQFEKTDQESIVRHWYQLQTIFDSVYLKGVIPKELGDFLSAYNLEAVDKFAASFTNYNEVRSRLLMHFKLEFWSLIVLLIFREHSSQLDA